MNVKYLLEKFLSKSRLSKASFFLTQNFLLKGLAFFVSVMLTSSSFSNPVLDNVSHGQISIQQSPNSMVINQSSPKAILNWRSFNIGNQQSTHFQQPAGGVALNRINPTQGASSIYGRLTATGQIILVNPAGFFFGPNAFVNVGGLVATTADISDQNFLNGIYQFRNVPGYTNSSIINEGQIIAAEHGLVALVAPNVINHGLIQANVGKVVLASGNAFTMNFAGNELISFQIDEGTLQSGNITNTGTISANGGSVLVTAKGAQRVLDNVINMGGVVEAKSVSKVNGELILGDVKIAGDTNAGVVRVASKVNVSGRGASQKGGRVTVTGHNILIDDDAVIDASGDVGGGEVLIGGNYQGKGSLPNSNAVVMMPNARILADAVTNGKGGDVILWSDHVTKAYGSISARGGAIGGDGGFIETSSHDYLDVNGINIDASAPYGKAGSWLLDPANLSISASANANVTLSSPFQPNAASAVLNITTLTNALASNDVTVLTLSDGFTGAGNLSVDTAISWTSPYTLTLNSFNNIAINNAITAQLGSLSLIAGGTISIGGAITLPNGTLSITAALPTSLNSYTTITPTAAVTVRNFNLIQGGWKQATASLPAFSAINFQTNSGLGYTTNVSFVRASGGTGTTIDPYTIVDVYGLQGMASGFHPIVSSWQLNNSIDATSTRNWNSGSGFMPIGSDAAHFNGNFNGQNFIISNLYINRPTAIRVGLFGMKGGGSVTNVGVVNADVTGGGDAGILAGWTQSASFNNVYTTGTLVSSGSPYSTGGLIGYSDSTIDNSYSGATVSSTTDYTGGLVGYADSNIEDSYAYGNVTGTSNVGGFAGRLNTGNTIQRSYSTGSATGTSNVGGFVGNNLGSFPVLNFWDTTTSGTGTGVGSGSSVNLTAGCFTGTCPNGGTAALSSLATYSGWSISSTPGGASPPGTVWYIFSNNTRPMLATEYSTTIRNAHQLQLANMAPSNTYTIGNNIDASGTGNPNDVWGSNSKTPSGSGFLPLTITTTFSGGGNVIDGLYIRRTTTDFVGLFGNIVANVTGVYINNATITGQGSVGGLAGRNIAGIITNSWFSGNVTGTGNNVGGLVGHNSSTINTSYSTGTVTASGAVENTGGLVGFNFGTLDNTYSMSNVSGVTDVGGLVGDSDTSSIDRSYATGSVLGTTNVGGLLGRNSTGTVTRSYWDSTTTGRTNAAGLVASGTVTASGGCFTGSGCAAGTANLGAQSNYGGWDFSTTWFIPNYGATTTSTTRPILRGELINTQNVMNAHQLQLVAANPSSSYLMTGNIDMSASLSSTKDIWGGTASGFVPIGDGSTSFKGVFDGNYYTISNLSINRAQSRVGLFSYMDGGTIQNLGLNSISVTGNAKVGGLVGDLRNSTISRVYGIGNVTGSTVHIGGLVGSVEGTSSSTSFMLNESFFSGLVSGGSGAIDVAGLVGIVNGTGSFIANVYSQAAIAIPSGGFNVGGISGFTNSNTTILNAYNTGYIPSATDAGGLVGVTNFSTVRNSFWDAAGGATTSTQGTTGTTIGGRVSSGGSAISNPYMTTTELMNDTNFQTGSAFITGQGWDLTNVWGIVDGASYPYLRAFFPRTPRAFSGVSDAVEQQGGTNYATSPVTLANNGVNLLSGRTGAYTGANGGYYFLLANGTVADNNIMLAYLNGVSSMSLTSMQGNSVFYAPASGGSRADLSMSADTLSVGGTLDDGKIYNTTVLNTAKGALSTDILYSVSGANLTLNSSKSFRSLGSTFDSIGNIGTTNGNIIFLGNLTLDVNSVFTATTSGNISIPLLTVASPSEHFDLTLNTSGTTTLGDIGSATTSIGTLTTNAGGTTVLDNAAIYANSNIVFNDAVQAINGNTLLDTPGSITFAQTLNKGNVGTTANLTLSPDTLLTFSGIVGGSIALDSLAVNGGITNINTSSITTSGDQNYQSTVRLLTNVTTASTGSGNMTFSTVDSSGTNRDFTVNTAGTTTFNGALGNTTMALNNFATDSPGNTVWNTTTLSTVGTISFGDAVSLANTMQIFTTNDKVTFSSTIDSPSIQSLQISAGSGDISLLGNIGSGGLVGILALDSTGITTLGGTVSNTTLNTNAGGSTVLSGGTINSTAAQTYGDAVTIAAPTTINVTSGVGFVNFNSTVDGANSLAINTSSPVTFNGLVGNTTPLASITTNSGGSTTINTTSIRTSGNQTYNDAVNLTNSPLLNSSSGNGAISFNSTLNGAQSLVINSGSGAVGFNSVGLTTPLINLSSIGSGTVTFAGAVGDNTHRLTSVAITGNTNLNNGSVFTSGAQTYSGTTILNANATINSTSGTINFAGIERSLATARNLTINTGGAILLTGNIGVTNGSLGTLSLTSTGATSFATNVNAASLSVDADGPISLNGSNITTSGTQNYIGNVLLSNNATSSLVAGDTVTFNGRIDTANVTEGLSVTAPTAIFKDNLGVTGNRLSSLTLAVDELHTDNNLTNVFFNIINDISIGDLTHSGKVVLGADTYFISDNGSITVKGSINSVDTTARDLGFDFSNDLNLSGNIGGTFAVNNLTAINSNFIPSTINFTGVSAVTSVGDQNYIDHIVFDSTPITFTSQTGAVNFQDEFNTNLSLDGNNTAITINNATASTVYGPITGSGVSLTKAGAGSLSLLAANTYDAGTTISQGTLILGQNNAIAAGSALTMNGGTLDLASFNQTFGAISGTGTITNSSGGGAATLTISNGVTNSYAGLISGNLNLFKDNIGTLTLSNAANTYTGSTSIFDGTLQVVKLANGGSASSIGQGSSAIVFGTPITSGTLEHISGITDSTNRQIQIASSGDGVVKVSNGGTLTLTGQVDTSDGGVNFDTDISSNLNVNGVISGSGIVAKLGAGTVTFGNSANTYSGQTNIAQGTLRVATLANNGVASSLGTGSTVQFSGETALIFTGGTGSTNRIFNKIGSGNTTFEALNAGTLTLSGNINNTSSGGLIFNASGGNISSSGVISGAGSLTKSGVNTLTLSGNNTYTGTTSINAGTLVANHVNALGTIAAGTTVASGATLNINNVAIGNEAITLGSGGSATLQGSGTSSLTGAITLASNSVLNTDGNFTLSGIISGPGLGITKTGTGTLTLPNANTYGGSTSISSGTVIVNNNASLSSGAVSVANGATLQLNDGITFGNALTLAGDGVGSAGALVADGTVIVNSDILQSAATTIAQMNDGGANSLTLNGDINNNGFDTNFVASVGDIAANGNISGAGGLSFTNGSFGFVTMSLAGVNQYTGATTVNSFATLRAASSNALGNGTNNTSSVTVSDNAAVELAVTSYNAAPHLYLSGDGALSSGALYNSAPATTTFDGDITLNSAITSINAMNGSTLILNGLIDGDVLRANFGTNGTLRLANTNNSFTGTMRISGGRLEAANVGNAGDPSAIGSGSQVFIGAGNTATLAVLGTSSSDRTMTTLGSGTSFIESNAGLLTLTGTIQGSALQQVGLYANGGDIDVAGSIQGGTGLQVSGNSGNGVILSGFNFFSGATQVNSGGYLIYDNDFAFGSTSGINVASGGALQLNNTTAVTFAGLTLNGTGIGGGGALISSGNSNYSGNVTLAGNTSINNTGTLTLLGDISQTGGSRSLTKLGTGTLALGGNNSYSGGTNVNAGTLSAQSNNAFGSAGVNLASGAGIHINDGLTINNDLTFAGNGSITGAGNVDLGGAISLAGNTTIDATSFDVGDRMLITGNISQTSASSINKTGDSILQLDGNNSYSNGTTISQGTIIATNDNSLGSGAVSVANGATLQLNDGITFGNALTLAGDGVGSAGALVANGSATASGNISLTGATTVGTSSALNSLLLSGVISGANSLSTEGQGIVTLSGNNTYSGVTNVNSGTLIANHANALGSTAAGTTVFSGATLNIFNNIAIGNEAITLGSGGSATLEGGSNSSLAGAVTLASNSVLNTAGTFTMTGIISGSGLGITKTGAGTLILSGNNTYTGTTAISAGTLSLGNSNVISDNSAVTLVAGTTLSLNTFTEAIGSLAGTGGTVNLGTGSLFFGDNTSTTFAGNIIGNGGITKVGNGSTTLSGNNSYTGATLIAVGSLIGGNSDFLPDQGAVTVASGASLNLGSFDETFGSLAGAGSVIRTTANMVVGGNNQDTTFSGTINGSGSIEKQGTGTLTLSGNSNAYSGSTTISAGRIIASHNSALGTGAISVASGSTLQVNGVSLNNGVSVAGTGSAAQGALVASGTGTVGGAVTLTGATTLGALSTNDILILSGAVNGGQALTIAGAGQTQMNGAVGNSSALTSITANARTTLGGSSITTSGDQTYFDTVTLTNANTTLTGDNISFRSTLDGNNVVINGSDFVDFRDAVNLASLEVSGLGGIGFDTASITTTGNQIYHHDVAIESDINLTASSGGIYIEGNIAGGGNALTLSHSADSSITGQMGGLSALNKEGSGTLSLSGNNTYVGNTTINGGRINITHANALGTGTVNVNTGTTLALVGTLGTVNNAFNFSNGTLLSSGNNTIATSVNLAGTNTFEPSASTTLDVTAPITGTGSIVKSGAGILRLSNSNNFSGGLTLIAVYLKPIMQ